MFGQAQSVLTCADPFRSPPLFSPQFYGPTHPKTCRAVRCLVSLLTDLPQDGEPRCMLPTVAPFYPLGTGWSPTSVSLPFLQKPGRRTASKAHGISWDPAFMEPQAIARRASQMGPRASGKRLIVGVGAASRRSPEERFEIATRALEAACSRLRTEFTSGHTLTAAAERLMVEVLRAQRKCAAAVPVAVTVLEATRGPAQAAAAATDAVTGALDALAAERTALVQLSECLMCVGRLEDAEAAAREAAESALRQFGADDPEALTHTHSHALILLELGRFAEAMPILRQTLGRREKALGKLHKDSLATGCALAHALMFLSQQSAEGAGRAARTLEDGGREFADGTEGLALQQEVSSCLRKGGEYLWEAAVLLKTALVARDNELGDSHPSTVATGFALWDAMDRAGRAEAGPLLKLMVLKEEACSGSLEELDQAIPRAKSGGRALKSGLSGKNLAQPPPIRATSSKYLGGSNAPKGANSAKSGPAQLQRMRSKGAIAGADKPSLQRAPSRSAIKASPSFNDSGAPSRSNSRGNLGASGKYGVNGSGAQPPPPVARNSNNNRSIHGSSGQLEPLGSSGENGSDHPAPKRQTTKLAFHPPFPMTGITVAGLRTFAAEVAKDASLRGRTTRDVCRRAVIPATAEFQCSFVELLEARATEGAVTSLTGQSSIFVSHAWDAPFDLLLSAVIAHVESIRTPPNSAPPAVWIDVFCLNQHDDRPLPRTWISGTITDGLRHMGQLLMVSIRHTHLTASPRLDAAVFRIRRHRHWGLPAVF